MRILTDVDNAVLNFSDAMQHFLATKGYVISERMRDHHNMPKLFSLEISETLELVREFHRSPAMGQLEPEPCAAIVLPELHRRGFRFVAITACLDEPEVVERRKKNLLDAFGFEFEAVHCVGLTLDKAPTLRAYRPSIWVEDMFSHALCGAELGHRSFILDRLYNRSLESELVTRVADWHAIAEMI